jgi:hypothetical protein
MRLLSLLTQAPKARHKRDSLPENQNTLYLQVQTSHHRQLKVDHSSHHKKCNTKRGNLQEKMSERHSRRESSFSEEKSHPYYNLLAFQSLAPKIAGRIESAYYSGGLQLEVRGMDDQTIVSMQTWFLKPDPHSKPECVHQCNRCKVCFHLHSSSS